MGSERMPSIELRESLRGREFSGVMHPKGKDFYGNFTATGISVGFMLVQAIQARGVEGIRVADKATDVYGNEMPDHKAVFMSPEAQRAYRRVYNSPEMAILRDATDDMFQVRPGRELQFDVPEAIPGFFSEKNRIRLKALTWDMWAGTLMKFADHSEKNGSMMGKKRYSEDARQATAKRNAILSPNWLGFSLPVKRDIAVMIDRVVAARLPEPAQEAA